MQAARSGHIEVVKLLLAAGADALVSDKVSAYKGMYFCRGMYPWYVFHIVGDKNVQEG